MARNLKLKDALQNTLLDSGIQTAFDTTAHLLIQTGSQPADADTAISGTTLADITLNADAFNAAGSGKITLNTSTEVSDTSANATGTAAWFRLHNTATESTAPNKIDGTVGPTNDIKVASGATNSGTANTITRTALSMTTDEHINLDRYVKVTAGTANGDERLIISNTSDTFTVTPDFSATPDGTTVFEVLERYDLELNSTSITSGDKVILDSFDIDVLLHN